MKRLPAPDYLQDGMQKDGSYQETARDFGLKRDGRWFVSVTADGHLTILVSPGFREGDCDVWHEADGVAVEQGYAVGRAMDVAFRAFTDGSPVDVVLAILRDRLQGECE